MPRASKRLPIGICDLCGEPFPAGVSHYTTKGKPRLHCSIECRQTANSRAGNPKRVRKVKERISRGEWENPSAFVREDATDEEREEQRRRIGVGAKRIRDAEVREGRWRNPALNDAAREKLSRPRTIDDPVLHRAIERLGHGETMADLTTEEAEAYRAHSRARRAARKDEANAYAREVYRKRMSTEAGRTRERERWERRREQLAQRQPNARLRAARERAGLSQATLADAVGLTQVAVSRWERFGSVPRDPATQEAVEKLLGEHVFTK